MRQIEACLKQLSEGHWLGGFWTPLLEEALSAVSLDVGPPKCLLDLGCGNAIKADIWRKQGIKTIGLERNQAQLSLAQKRFREIDFMCGDATVLPFGNHAVDIVFTFSVFQYVDWQAMVQECHRVLKPGGCAIFIENLAGNPLTKLYRWVHQFRKWRYPEFQDPLKHLAWKQIDSIKSVFHSVEATPYHFLSPLLLAKPMFQHKLLGHLLEPVRPQSLERLHKWDQMLLAHFPVLAHLCWNVVIVCRK